MNARRLYRTCMDERAIEMESTSVVAQLVVRELGGWPSDYQSLWKKSLFDLSAALLKLNQYNTFPFFYATTMIDYNYTDSLRYVIRVRR